MPYIGPDTVDLVIREPAPGVDANGQPNRTERIVPKGNSCVTVVDRPLRGAPIDAGNAAVKVFHAKIALPADDDTAALTDMDAVAHDGRVYELSNDAVIKRTLRGAADHVRVFGSHEEPADTNREAVTITPRFGRDDSGTPRADGDPVTVFARGINPGNTTLTYGVSGAVDEVDFTIALDPDVVIKNGDAVTVRGRTGHARVEKYLEEWANRDQIVVTVRSVIGGR